MADEMTNMSSTPIPISMNGKRLWIPADLAPTKYANPEEEAKLSPTQSRAMPPAADLKWIGEKDPMKTMQYTETSPTACPTMARSFIKSDSKAS